MARMYIQLFLESEGSYQVICCLALLLCAFLHFTVVDCPRQWRCPGEGGLHMKLRIRYENEIQTIELNEKDTEVLWGFLSLEGEELSQEEREELIQETWEEQYNRPDYNQYHRETRYIDPTPKRKKMDGTRGYICGDKDDQSFNIMDYLTAHDPISTYEKKFDYEECCDRIRTAVKPEQAEMLIAMILDELKPAEYASITGDTANNVSHKYRRALKNLQKYFSKASF